MHIRNAEAADLPALRRIVATAYTPYTARMGRAPAPLLDDYAALVQRRAVWCGETGGAVAGLIVLLPEDGHLLVDNVAVDPAWQGRGLGRALLAFAEDAARRAGLTELRLYTNAAMVENIALYAALGWQETHRGEQDGYHRVFFRKKLAPGEHGGGA